MPREKYFLNIFFSLVISAIGYWVIFDVIPTLFVASSNEFVITVQQSKEVSQRAILFGTNVDHYVVDTDGNIYEVDSPRLYAVFVPGQTYTVTIRGSCILSAQLVQGAR